MKHDYENITNEQIEAVINSYIHSERDRIILKLNLVDNWTYQQIADYLYKLDCDNREKGIITHYGISAKHIGRVILKKEKIVFNHLS